MTTPWYVTREEVKAALDAGDTSRSNAQIDRLIAAASRHVEALTHRRFYPEVDTRYFAWPDDQMGTSWRLWLDQHEVLSVDTLSSGGTTITSYFLEPQASGPPYNRVEIDLSGPSAFGGGDTWQRSITIVGTFGACDTTIPAGTLAGAITSSVVELQVSDSSLIGVGSLIAVGSERMQVTARRMVATGDTGTLAAAPGDRALAVTDGTLYAVGETLLLGSERVLIDDIAGDTLLVRRATDGSVLAAHAAATIYAPRTLAVRRAALGTTAAAHSDGAAVLLHQAPEEVRELCLAETLVALGREQSGYARTIGSGEGQRAAPAGDLRDLRQQVKSSLGRTARTRVV